MTQPLPYKRRNVFIHRAFQGKFIAWMLGMIVVFAICSAVLMYILLSSDLENETRTAHLRIVDTWQKLGLSIVVSNLVSALFAGLSVCVVVVYISHKIAGPMFRFQKICKEIGSGNLEVSVHLRDKDQLQELAIDFGDMVENLKLRRHRYTENLNEIRQLLDEIHRDGKDNDRIRDLTTQAQQKLAQAQPE